MKKYYTIDSEIVKDSLDCLSKNFPESIYLSGGMSAQFFLPKEYRRNSGDLDFDGPVKPTYSKFKETLKDLIEPCDIKTLNFKKSRYTYDGILEYNEDSLSLQFPRRSLKSFDQHYESLNRELENTIDCDYNNNKIKLINPNDLIIRKIRRSEIFKREYNIDKTEIPKNLNQEIQKINWLKETFDIQDVNPKEAAYIVAEVRLIADIFDIKTLMTYYEDINEKYIMNNLDSIPVYDKKSLNQFVKFIFD